MIILSLDSSAAAGSAAVLEDGKLIYEAFANEGLTHSETLLVRCDEALKKAGTGPKNVDLYAVTAGPGSFTGLRIGMGLLKGLAFGAGKPCVAVPTFDALAEGAKDCGRDLLTVLDARQKRAYYAAFRCRDGRAVRLCEDGLLPISELEGRCRELGMENVLVAGDCADAAAAAAGGETAPGEMNDVHAGCAGAVAYRMYLEGKSMDAAELRPFYLQLSQAERNRKEKETL